MKKLLRACVMCFSMFCAIPSPFHVWDDEARPLMTLFLPAVGAWIGLLWTGCAYLTRFFGLPALLSGAILCAFPFLVTGGMHMDGFLDEKPLATLPSGCQWSKYPADCGVDGRYPVALTSRGLAWLEMDPTRIRIASVPPRGRRPDHPIAQDNGVARLGERFICTAGAGYRIVSRDGTESEWRPFAKGGHSGAPRTDGRHVVLTSRASRIVSVWDFSDAENPRLLRRYALSGNPDLAALWNGKALIPAGHQGLLFEK